MEEIKNIKERLLALPEGIWKRVNKHIFSVKSNEDMTAVCLIDGFFDDELNSNFIENAPQDMHYLISLVGHLQKEMRFLDRRTEALEVILDAARHTPWDVLYGTGLMKAIERYDAEAKRLKFYTRIVPAPPAPHEPIPD